MTAQVWDKAPVTLLGSLPGPIARRTCIPSAIDGGEPQAAHARLRPALDRRRARMQTPTTSRRTAPRSRSPPTPTQRRRPELRHLRPADRGRRRTQHHERTTRATTSRRCYSPDGRLLAFRRQTIKGFYADRARLMIYDRRGEQDCATSPRDWDRSADGLVWSPDSDAHCSARSTTPAARRIYRFDVGGGAPRADHARAQLQRRSRSPAAAR